MNLTGCLSLTSFLLYWLPDLPFLPCSQSRVTLTYKHPYAAEVDNILKHTTIYTLKKQGYSLLIEIKFILLPSHTSHGCANYPSSIPTAVATDTKGNGTADRLTVVI